MANKKMIYGIVFIAILSIFIVANNSDYLSFASSDFTFTSIDSDIDIISNDNDLENANFLITAVVNGGGQSLSGMITPSNFKSETGYDTENNIVIRCDNVEQKLQYPISNTGNKLFNYYYEIEDSYECPAEAENTLRFKGDILGFGKGAICVYREQTGIFGKLQTVPNRATSMEIIVDNGDERISKTLSTVGSLEDSKSVNLYDGSTWIGNVKWVGDLDSGKQPPDGTSYKAYYSDTSDNWKVISELRYNEYLSEQIKLEAFLEGREVQIATSRVYAVDAIDDILDDYDDVYSTVINKRVTSIDGSAVTVGDSSSISNADVEFIADTLYGYPELLMTLDAEYIGIVIPTGEPEIIAIECDEFLSGNNNGICYVKVKNIGDNSASFSVSMEETYPFKQTGTSDVLNIDSGEIRTFNVNIFTDTYGTAISKDIKFKVIDYNNPDNFDTDTVKISMLQPAQCVEGDYNIEGRIVYLCENGQQTEILRCDYGEEPKKESTDKYVCEPDVSTIYEDQCPNINIGTTQIPDYPCIVKVFIETYKIIILAIIAGSVLVIGYVGINVVKVYINTITGGLLDVVLDKIFKKNG